MRRRLLIAVVAGRRRWMVILHFGFCVHCDHLRRRNREKVIKNLWASDVKRLPLVEMFFRSFYNPFRASIFLHVRRAHKKKSLRIYKHSWKIYGKSFSPTRYGELHERRNENCFKVNDFSSVVERLKDQKMFLAGAQRGKGREQHKAGRNKELRFLFGFTFYVKRRFFNCETFPPRRKNKKHFAINSRQQFSAIVFPKRFPFNCKKVSLNHCYGYFLIAQLCSTSMKPFRD